MKKNLLYFLLFISFFKTGYSQIGYFDKPTEIWISGEDLNFITGVKSMQIVILYDSLKIMGKDDEVYQQEIADRYEKEEAGKGIHYMERWHSSKGDLFKRIYIKTAIPRLKKLKIKSDYTMNNADCIMKVYPLNTTVGTPGITNVTANEPAYCDFRIFFIKDQKTVGEVLMKNCAGRSSDWDLSFIGRYKNCFTVCSYYLTDNMVLKMREKK